MVIGLLLIWWDVKRKDAAKLDFNQKLAVGFYLGCTVLCISVWTASWYISPQPVKAAPPAPPPRFDAHPNAYSETNPYT